MFNSTQPISGKITFKLLINALLHLRLRKRLCQAIVIFCIEPLDWYNNGLLTHFHWRIKGALGMLASLSVQFLACSFQQKSCQCPETTPIVFVWTIEIPIHSIQKSCRQTNCPCNRLRNRRCKWTLKEKTNLMGRVRRPNLVVFFVHKMSFSS